MPIGIYEKDDVDAVANAIRNNLGNGTKYTVGQMPSAIDEIQTYAYNNGHSEGYGEGKTDGLAEGKKSQYDEFWDAIQEYGNKTDYTYAYTNFKYHELFYPKYSMQPYTLNTAFWSFGRKESNPEKYVDLVERFDNRGLVLDTSKCTNFSSTFMWANIKRIGIFDLTSASSALSSTFGYGAIINIDKLIVNENTPFTSNTFQNQAALEEIRFEGVIGVNINFQWSTKLSHESLMSIINSLKDNGGTDTWKVITLGAENIAKLSAEELLIMRQKQWEYG